MTERKLPIGMQTFRQVRDQDCYYVDKTRDILKLATGGKHYFLSRPRRFGKSLLVDTLKELFEGNQRLFEGLHIHDGWDWSARHPVALTAPPVTTRSEATRTSIAARTVRSG